MKHPDEGQRSRSGALAAPHSSAAPLLSKLDFAALGVYLSLSVFFFGRGVLGRLTTSYIGQRFDQTFFAWCLVWWPYALAHWLNPFVSKLVFAPVGLNLTWTTSIPLLSLAAFPLTRTFGPIATFNVLELFAPALSAWTAFLLCRYLTARFWPALIGGYVFGFSAYMLTQLAGGHMHMVAIFLVPLALQLVMMALDGRLAPRSFSIALSAVLTAQFLISSEVFATMTFFGSIALILGWALTDAATAKRITRLLIPIAFSYLGSFVLVSPYLYYFFAGLRWTPIYSPMAYSTDLVNFLVPTRASELGQFFPFTHLASAFSHYWNFAETGGYLGPGLVVLAVWFAVECWRTARGRLLIAMMVAAAIASLGPRLHVDGGRFVSMPWRIATHVPVIQQALPARFTMYLFLAMALATAIWFSAARPRWVRAGAGALLLASLLPNLSASFWTTAPVIPQFFTQGMYKQYLAPGEIVAVWPWWQGAGDFAMLMQIESKMYFRIAGGHYGITPQALRLWPCVGAPKRDRPEVSEEGAQWRAFFAAQGINLIMTWPPSPPPPRQVLAALGDPTPVNAGGVTLYRIKRQALAPYRDSKWWQMEAMVDGRHFDQMVVRAAGQPKAISALIERMLRRWRRHRKIFAGDKWAGPWPGGRIALGEAGAYRALRPIAMRYRGCADETYLPYPHLFDESRRPNPDMQKLQFMVAVFSREGLRCAAELARRALSPLPRAGAVSVHSFMPAPAKP